MYNEKMWENFYKIKETLVELGKIGENKFIEFNRFEKPTKKLIKRLNILMNKQRNMINIIKKRRKK